MRLYNATIEEKESFEAGVKLALQAVLVSPHFLFRGETPAAAAVAAASTSRARPIGEFALASRLSYFLWSSTPDDELLDLATRGQLRKNLDAQVHRMLTSPKASATPSSVSLRSAARENTWKPPLSVRIGYGQRMNLCRPPSRFTRSAPGRSMR